VAERGKPGHVGRVEWVSAVGDMFKGGLGVDRLPEDDDVDHDAAVELAFLPGLVDSPAEFGQGAGEAGRGRAALQGAQDRRGDDGVGAQRGVT